MDICPVRHFAQLRSGFCCTARFPGPSAQVGWRHWKQRMLDMTSTSGSCCGAAAAGAAPPRKKEDAPAPLLEEEGCCGGSAPGIAAQFGGLEKQCGQMVCEVPVVLFFMRSTPLEQIGQLNSCPGADVSALSVFSASIPRLGIMWSAPHAWLLHERM